MQAGNLRYVVQDDEGHQVRELALPPNFTAEIEIGYRPRLAFREEKLIVGCEGDEACKPIVLGYLNKLVREGKSRWDPGQDGHMLDRHGFYHLPRNEARSARLHCIVGFILQSRNPGTYRFKLAFVTAEGVGEARLTIHVLDKPPRPIMRCIIPEHRQRGCFLTAAVVVDEQASERHS